ncbi:nigwaprin-a-like [Palaemon carinicauda]|uniref:nigwaprin-a-like n=1 Tax=Palaemon carinicauda TaxID=392227 RepID=UPI0035B64E45
MANIGNHGFLCLLALLLLLGTMTEYAKASPGKWRPPYIGDNGCPLLPAPPPQGGFDLDPTQGTRVCEQDRDCRGRQICCPTGACCGTYCYDPPRGYRPIDFPSG